MAYGGKWTSDHLYKEHLMEQLETTILDSTIPHRLLFWCTPSSELVQYSTQCEAPQIVENGGVEVLSFTQLGEPAFSERLRSSIPRGISHVYAPTVARMSSVVLGPERFTDIYPLGSGVNVYRPGFQKNSNEKEGCDGTLVGPSEGFVGSFAGCPFIVLSGPTHTGEKLCLAAHAGRDSLMDKRLIASGTASRSHFSIVDALVAFARKQHADPRELTLRSFFSIPWEAYPHNLNDPEYAQINRQRYVFLGQHQRDDGIFIQKDGVLHFCLSSLIQYQAKQLGIGRIETGLCTLPKDGAHAYTTHPSLGGSVRNLVLLTRR